MNYEIGNPEMAWLLAAIPVVVLLYLRSAWLTRRARRVFGCSEGQGRWFADTVSLLLLTSGVALLALACMDIRWGKTTREVPQRGLEVVFALDVSRSMLAQDAKPNRLARAKQQVKDMLAEMAGDRVGLIVFAGDAKQAVPLTNHYHDFQQKLDTVGPDSVVVGGSQLGVAIKAASEAFLSKTNDHKTMVLFTDGEDQESKPVELTKQLHAESGLRIFTVGLGDVTEGSRIPEDARGQGRRGGKFVQHNGQQVWSKLNGSILKQIATESDGAYIPAGTKRVNMAEVYHRYIASVEKSEFETAKINALIPRFQWFAFPAFVCLWLHVWLSGGPAGVRSASASRRNQSAGRSERISKVAQAAAVILVLLPVPVNAQATDQRDQTVADQTVADQTVADQINAANELVRKNKTTQAIEAYNAIEGLDAEHQDELNYNLASAHYRNSDIDSALALFTETAKSSNDQLASHSRYNLGNCRYAKALPLAQQNPEAAIAELQQAIAHFRSALRLDRNLANARENLERATMLLQQLKQQQEDQQDQQSDPQGQPSQDGDQDSDPSEQDSDPSEQDGDSEQESDGDQQSESQQQQNSDSSKSQENQESEQQSDQQSGSESGDSNEDSNQQSSRQQGDQSSGEEAADQQDDSAEGDQGGAESQQNLDGSSQSGQDDAASESEEKNASETQGENGGKQTPEGELSSINPSESDDSSEQENASGAIAQQSESENGMMTQQEALKLLQAVRDRDMIRRYRQRQRQRQQKIPVEKDW